MPFKCNLQRYSAGHRVWSVEVWAGMRKCDSVKYGIKAGLSVHIEYS